MRTHTHTVLSHITEAMRQSVNAEGTAEREGEERSCRMRAKRRCKAASEGKEEKWRDEGGGTGHGQSDNK